MDGQNPFDSSKFISGGGEMALAKEAKTVKTKVVHLIESHKIGGAERLLLAFAQAIDLNRFDVVLAIFVRPD